MVQIRQPVQEGEKPDLFVAQQAAQMHNPVEEIILDASLLAGLDSPPSVLLSGSAIGWYGDTGGREVDESAPAGPGFLAGGVKDWEGAGGPTGDPAAGRHRHGPEGGRARQAAAAVPARAWGPARTWHAGHELGSGGRLGPGRQGPAR